MFELVFAWTVFTLVLGKSAEAVTHAWKGTAPPSHLRKMARIRAAEAKSLRGGEPAGAARAWARTVWADSWEAATERHKERWPTKAAKKAEYARTRWAAWDETEEELGRRWDARARARREGSEGEGPGAADKPRPDRSGRDETARDGFSSPPRPGPEPTEPRRTGRGKADPGPVYDGSPPTTRGLITLQRLSEANLEAQRRRAREEKAAREGRFRPPPPDPVIDDLTKDEFAGLTDHERRVLAETDPEVRNDQAGERGRIIGTIYRRRDDRARRPAPKKAPEKAPEGASAAPSDTPDATPKTAGEGPDGGVRDSRTPGHPPVSGGPGPTPGTSTHTTKEEPVAEVISLEGATRLTHMLVRKASVSLERLEAIVAWLSADPVLRQSELNDRFGGICIAQEAFLAEARLALQTCQAQAGVREAVEAAGTSALSKETLMGRRTES
ncbi:hypothetical protein [Nocardiopsis sp. NPDC055824]